MRSEQLDVESTLAASPFTQQLHFNQFQEISTQGPLGQPGVGPGQLEKRVDLWNVGLGAAAVLNGLLLLGGRSACARIVIDVATTVRQRANSGESTGD
jgi:hypothetical protein